MWWGGWSRHHFSLHYSLCLEISRLRHLHTRIRESILSISLSSRLSRAIGQSPYQPRVLAVTSRCVYRPSVVQLLVWVSVCVCLVAFYLSLHCSRVSLRAHPLPFHSSFEEKLYSAFIAITDIAAAKVYTIISLIDIISLGYITRFENMFSTAVSVNLRLKID